MGWYMRAIQTGAPWSTLLLFGQVVLLAMLIERTLFLLVKGQVNITLFLAMLKKLASAGDLKRAIKLTMALDAPAGRVCRVGLEGIGKGPFLLADELDRAIAKELPAIRRRLGAIPLVALAVAALGALGSPLSEASAPESGGSGPLPFGLGEEYALALVGVPFGLVGLIWVIALGAKAKQIVLDLARCKALLLELDGNANAEGPRAPTAG
jgi:hypothetical protein